MAFKLVNPKEELKPMDVPSLGHYGKTIHPEDFGDIKQAETMNEIFGEGYVPVPKEDSEILYVRIGVRKKPDGTPEYLIENEDMEFVVRFLNGLANKLKENK